MTNPLPDSTGWQITPTLHKAVNDTTDPSKMTLPCPFAVCIIGASRGIGAHIAYAYATAGASGLVLAGRDNHALQMVADEARRVARKQDLLIITATCDVTSDASVHKLAEQVRTDIGRLDVLVVNAGLWGETAVRVTEGSTKQFQDVVNTDLVGAYLASHYLIPILLASEGGAKALIAISGTGAWLVDGPVAHAAHCVSKLAQARLVEHMGNNFSQEGLLAVAVHPGCVWTDTSKLAPDMFHQYLTDDAGLCGGFLVWLTMKEKDRLWLSGRFLSATWDVDELLQMKEAIVKSDMLKARMVVS
ncbi:MAG: hypothetical protein Q9226_007894 [Calogaya cf. arnoldii]